MKMPERLHTFGAGDIAYLESIKDLNAHIRWQFYDLCQTVTNLGCKNVTRAACDL